MVTSTYCSGPDRFQEVCRPSDGCDPFAQTGCGQGLACYLRPADTGTGVLSVCFPPATPALPDGSACRSTNGCAVGSSCFGPIDLPRASWTNTDLKCRQLCADPSTLDAEATASDAGLDDAGAGDAGTTDPTGCRTTGSQCLSYATTGLSFASIPAPPFGQCEP